MSYYRRHTYPKEPTKEQKQQALKRTLTQLKRAVDSLKTGINPPRGAKFIKAKRPSKRGYTGNSHYGRYRRY